MENKRAAEVKEKGGESESNPAEIAVRSEPPPESETRTESPESPPPAERGTRESSVEPPRTLSRAVTPRIRTEPEEADTATEIQPSQTTDKTQ